MSVVRMKQLLKDAREGDYAIGYFESWDLYSLEAALEAAEETASPAIFGFGGAVTNQQWLNEWGVKDLACLARRIAERATVPAAILCNEARTLDQIHQALDMGCNAVMLDTSDMPFEENVELTSTVVQLAQSYKADVEAELGHLPDGIELTADGQLTDPQQAKEFVERTSIQALAVSIGNAHLVSDGAVEVDIDLLSEIHQAIDIPLVVHGGSGFPHESIQAAIKNGVAKFNVGTKLKLNFLNAVRAILLSADEISEIHAVVGSRDNTDFLTSAMNVMKEEIKLLMHLYGSTGKASTN